MQSTKTGLRMTAGMFHECLNDAERSPNGFKATVLGEIDFLRGEVERQRRRANENADLAHNLKIGAAAAEQTLKQAAEHSLREAEYYRRACVEAEKRVQEVKVEAGSEQAARKAAERGLRVATDERDEARKERDELKRRPSSCAECRKERDVAALAIARLGAIQRELSHAEWHLARCRQERDTAKKEISRLTAEMGVLRNDLTHARNWGSKMESQWMDAESRLKAKPPVATVDCNVEVPRAADLREVVARMEEFKKWRDRMVEAHNGATFALGQEINRVDGVLTQHGKAIRKTLEAVDRVTTAVSSLTRAREVVAAFGSADEAKEMLK